MSETHNKEHQDMTTIWILVANQAEAQIYSTNRLPGSLTPVHSLRHAEGAAHARDLTSDAPGRVHDRMGSARHSMEPDTGVKEEERRRFVKEIVDRLEAAHLKGEFSQLVLLVAPGVLGVIRKTLTGDLAKAVIKEIPKDVVAQSLDKIEEQLKRSFELK
jgi:protein required for attachment to host cells